MEGMEVGALAPTNPPLHPSAGALGDETRSGRKRSKKDKKKHSKDGGGKRFPPLIPPGYDEAPLSEKDNLAGRVDAFIRGELGVKKQEVKVARPYHQVNLTAEPYVIFTIQSSKSEFIRVRPDSLSLVFYGTYQNPGRVAESPDPELRAERWAFRARTSHPPMFCDPSVMGTGIFQKAEVSIDNVPVNSNADLNSMLLHYTRASRVFTDKPPGPYFRTNADFALPQANVAVTTEPMKTATGPFDHTEWDNRTGTRLPVYLEGVFPFSLKNRTIASIDRRKDPNLYLPPDTTLTVKLISHRTKFESFFHPEIATQMHLYWNEDVVEDVARQRIRFVIQDALLEYDSVELHPQNHADLMRAFANKGKAVYNYDKVCCQYTALLPNLSSVQTRFQIPPFARLAYIFFVPDHATLVMDATRRPLSALTRFPAHCSGLTVNFAGSPAPLVTGMFENFGVSGAQVEISKKIYWDYLKNKRMIAGEFDHLFPKDPDDYSVIQALVFDLRDMTSAKTEALIIQCDFAGPHNSPARRNILVMTVHPSGRLICSQENGRWIWQFDTRSS